MKLSKKQTEIALNLLRKPFINDVKTHTVFEIGGRYFIGDYMRACESFAYNNPDGGDFIVWLQDNWKQI